MKKGIDRKNKKNSWSWHAGPGRQGRSCASICRHRFQQPSYVGSWHVLCSYGVVRAAVVGICGGTGGGKFGGGILGKLGGGIFVGIPGGGIPGTVKPTEP